MEQKKYAEAEPWLLSGYNGIKERETKIPTIEKKPVKDALRFLVQFYKATGKPQESAKLKRELAMLGI